MQTKLYLWIESQFGFYKIGSQVFSHLFNELFGCAILVPGDIVGVVNTNGEIFSHKAFLDGFDHGPF